jgi:hypothetical protein
MIGNGLDEFVDRPLDAVEMIMLNFDELVKAAMISRSRPYDQPVPATLPARDRRAGWRPARRDAAVYGGAPGRPAHRRAPDPT